MQKNRINLESLTVSGKALEDEYIDAILYEDDYNTNLNTNKQLTGNTPNDENKVITAAKHAYSLYNFTLKANEERDFNLLLYMDPDTPMEDANMNASWKGKITLSTSYKEEPIANLNGLKVPVVENGDGLYAVSHNVSEISTDWNKTEYRYAGANVNNYVSFNNEIWRIIGLVNVKTDSGIEQRLKIIRQDGANNQKDFGTFSWDYGEGKYENDWTQSTLKDMLNGIYYESNTGDCYKQSGKGIAEQCDFSNNENYPKGLDGIAREMIDKEVIWTLGGVTPMNSTKLDECYEQERGISTYENNPIEWSSKTDVGNKHNGIGLMYTSDYGYSVGGTVKTVCLEKYLFDYDSDNCKDNTWLIPANMKMVWTITPINLQNTVADFVHFSGKVFNVSSIDNDYSIWPTLYLKSSVKITPNPQSEQEYGTIDNPFQLSND